MMVFPSLPGIAGGVTSSVDEFGKANLINFSLFLHFLVVGLTNRTKPFFESTQLEISTCLVGSSAASEMEYVD